MDSLLTDFLNLLEEEIALYRGLLLVLQKEKRAVVYSNLNELNESGKEKESLILKIRILEEQRLRFLEKLADSRGYPSQDFTLIQLSQLAEEPYSTRFKNCHSKFLALIQSIREINQINKALLMHSQELVRGSLALLNNFMASSPVYHRTGKIQAGDQSGKVLSGKI